MHGEGLVFGTIGGALAVYLVWWLKEVPRVWCAVTRLLDDTRPIPMSLRIETQGTGKTERAVAKLRGGGRRLSYSVGGLLTPSWFNPGHGVPKRVFVYGADDPETPVIIKFPDGSLVLVEP